MKAAKAAGIDAFELVDPASGLIFRASGGWQALGADDLDAELERFEVRRSG